MSKTSTLSSEKVLCQEDSKFIDFVLQGAKKSFLFHFKRCNLEINVVNFFLKNSTHYFSYLRQDPIVGSHKIKIKINLCNLY
jgi:hypothetical protein